MANGNMEIKTGFSLLEKTPEWQTIEYLLKTGKSLARFGDGERQIIYKNKGMATMQDFDSKLQTMLINIMRSQPENLCITVHDKQKWKEYIKPDRYYGSAFFVRPSYLGLGYYKYFNKIKELWQDRDIVLVNFNIKIGYLGLFDNTRTISFIPIPMRHCFSEFDEIWYTISQHFGSKKVFLISAGPTACVLAHKISEHGEYCLDIGKIAFEYAKFKKMKNLHQFISQDSWKEKKRVFKYNENMEKVEVKLDGMEIY